MRGISALVFGALVLAACGTKDDTDTDELSAEKASNVEAQMRMELALHCMNASDRLGKFYLTVSEVEDNQTEAASLREQATAYVPVIKAFEEYADNRAEEIELTETEYQSAADDASAWFDERFEAQEFEEYLSTIDAEVKNCETELEAGTFG